MEKKIRTITSKEKALEYLKKRKDFNLKLKDGNGTIYFLSFIFSPVFGSSVIRTKGTEISTWIQGNWVPL